MPREDYNSVAGSHSSHSWVISECNESIELEFEDYPLTLTTHTDSDSVSNIGNHLSWNANYLEMKIPDEESDQTSSSDQSNSISNTSTRTYVNSCPDVRKYLCLGSIEVKNQTQNANDTILTNISTLFECPPLGILFWLYSVIFISVSSWTLLWSLFGHEILPGGYYWAPFILTVISYVIGQIFKVTNIPPLIGMILTGIIYRNVSVLYNETAFDKDLSSILRSVGCTVILVRAGLAIDTKLFLKSPAVTLRLAFFPSLFEALAIATAANSLLKFPWSWSFLLGFSLAPISATIVIPLLLDLNSKGYGVKMDIPSLCMASSCLDQVIALTGFFVVIDVHFQTGSLIWSVFRSPVGVVAGILYGAIVGSLLWFIPDKTHANYSSLQVITLLLSCLNAIFLAKICCIEEAGIIACVSTPIFIAIGWRKINYKFYEIFSDILKNGVSRIAEPIYFVLIGVEIDLSNINADSFGSMVGVMLIGCLARVISVQIVMCKSRYNCLERLFMCFAWLPKAPSQIYAVSIIMEKALQLYQENQDENFTKEVSTSVFIGVLTTTPIGCIMVSFLGPLLLQQDEDIDNTCAKFNQPDNCEKFIDDDSTAKGTLSWDDQDLKMIFCEKPHNNDSDFTSEKETVT